MKILQGDIIDWEPAILTLRTRRGRLLGGAEVSAFFQQWFLRRDELKICPCFDKYFSIQQLSPSSVQVACELLCNTCFELLIEDIATSIPTIVTAKLGHDWTEDDAPPQRFIQIPTKIVVFEDGSRTQVATFIISQQPVSISKFEAFVFATNYVTTAQRQDDTQISESTLA